MSNPFTQNDLEILKEAFPTLSESVIDDILHSCRGEVNQAFEILLSMSDPTQLSPPVPPQLPNRPNVKTYFTLFNLFFAKKKIY